MSYFDDASLVFIPSGTKTSKAYSVKPIDGTGDLTFSRSNDTATRVASNGLIEKVRTNLFTYSEQLDNAAWTKADTAIVANAVANPLNGAVTADKMTDASTATAARYIYQSPASSGTIYTSSGYFKKGEYNFVTLHAFGINGAVFNLDTGVKVSQSGGVGNITSVGDGWYRCTFTFTAGGSSVFFSQSPAGNISYAGTVGSGIFAFGLQVETGDIATDYIATTSAAVSVGPVANVPRLDYLNSSCPRLLLEPQRTNLATYSEQFDNAAWSKYQATITANAGTSPDGSTNADKFLDNTNNDTHNLYAAYTISGDTTFSIFVKSAEYTRFAAQNLSDGGEVIFNLSTATVVSTSANYKNAKIENYGNGWYRVSATTNGVSGSKAMGWALVNNAGVTTFTGTGTSGVFVYGFQTEAGAYATSYIPTLGSASTRGADAASKTGISSLIGQTEGTLFLEANISNLSEARRGVVLYSDGNNLITLRITSGNNLQFLVIESGATQANFTIANPQGSIKMALAYKANDFAAYLNGTLVGTDTNGTVPAASAFYLGYDPAGALQIAGGISQALLFKTRLTNAQLAELTSL